MPKVIVYVPVALYRQVEELAPANGYESADDYVRSLSLATIDELVTGVQMRREVMLSEGETSGGPGVGRSAQEPARIEPPASPSESDHFKPDFKTAKAEKKGRR